MSVNRLSPKISLIAIGLSMACSAYGSVDSQCGEVAIPDGYDEQVQQDFLGNYYALALTYSPVHGPVPHEGGHGALGVDLAIIPPLACEQRFVLNHSKTEDTNKVPVAPRIRATFAFPAIGPIVIYAGAAYVPPIPLMGTRNVLFSAELGLGSTIADMYQLGLRVHGTLGRTIGDVATAFNEDDPAVVDLFLGSTMGVDGMFGVKLKWVTPYVAIGFTDASTFFYVGDDGVVVDNLHPYAGATFSVGVDGLVLDRFRFGAEFYGAPGGVSVPDASISSVADMARYGHIYTARLRFAVEL